MYQDGYHEIANIDVSRLSHCLITSTNPNSLGAVLIGRDRANAWNPALHAMYALDLRVEIRILIKYRG